MISTNAHVSYYQISTLPVPKVVDGPDFSDWRVMLEQGRWNDIRQLLVKIHRCQHGCMLRNSMEVLVALAERIEEIEVSRELRSRSERAFLAPESEEIQAVIDDVLFACFGLTNGDAGHVRARLGEML